MDYPVNSNVWRVGTMTTRPRVGLRYYVGVDLGQKQDYSAVAVVEREVITGTRRDPATWELDRRVVHTVRYLERMPLGMPYPDVAASVARLARDIRMTNPCELVVDQTGVGAPVVDLLKRAGTRCWLWPVTITGGEHEQSTSHGYSVPKRDLVVGLQVLLETGGLEVSRGVQEGGTFIQELRTMRVTVTGNGHETFGAGRSGEHDDLVLAVALACWRAKKDFRSS